MMMLKTLLLEGEGMLKGPVCRIRGKLLAETEYNIHMSIYIYIYIYVFISVS